MFNQRVKDEPKENSNVELYDPFENEDIGLKEEGISLTEQDLKNYSTGGTPSCFSGINDIWDNLPSDERMSITNYFKLAEKFRPANNMSTATNNSNGNNCVDTCQDVSPSILNKFSNEPAKQKRNNRNIKNDSLIFNYSQLRSPQNYCQIPPPKNLYSSGGISQETNTGMSSISHNVYLPDKNLMTQETNYRGNPPSSQRNASNNENPVVYYKFFKRSISKSPSKEKSISRSPSTIRSISKSPTKSSITRSSSRKRSTSLERSRDRNRSRNRRLRSRSHNRSSSRTNRSRSNSNKINTSWNKNIIANRYSRSISKIKSIKKYNREFHHDRSNRSCNSIEKRLRSRSNSGKIGHSSRSSSREIWRRSGSSSREIRRHSRSSSREISLHSIKRDSSVSGYISPYQYFHEHKSNNSEEVGFNFCANTRNLQSESQNNMLCEKYSPVNMTNSVENEDFKQYVMNTMKQEAHNISPKYNYFRNDNYQYDSEQIPTKEYIKNENILPQNKHSYRQPKTNELPYRQDDLNKIKINLYFNKSSSGKAKIDSPNNENKLRSYNPSNSDNVLPPISKFSAILTEEYSLNNFISLLDSISESIGALGPALKVIISDAKEKIPFMEEVLEVFLQTDVKILIDMCIDKISMGKTFGESSLEYQKAKKWTKLLFEQAEMLKNDKNRCNGTYIYDLDIDTMAKVTLGKGSGETIEFIQNMLIYKGVAVTKEAVNEVFKAVSAQHLKILCD